MLWKAVQWNVDVAFMLVLCYAWYCELYPNQTIIIPFTEQWMLSIYTAWCCMVQQSVIGIFLPFVFDIRCVYIPLFSLCCALMLPFLCGINACYVCLSSSFITHHVSMQNPLPFIHHPLCHPFIVLHVTIMQNVCLGPAVPSVSFRV